MHFILFDAYGTLVELDDFYARLKRGFETAGVLLPLEVVMRAARAEMKHYIAHTIHARTEADWNKLKSDCVSVLAESIRAQEYSLDLSHETVLEILDGALIFRVFPEVREILETLKARGVGMGVLSNWDGSLRNVLRDLDLIRFFDFVLVSAEVGIQKPARAFFEMGLQKAQAKYSALRADECFYVGDHYDGDVAGARGADMVPVWLVRDKRDLASGELRDDGGVLRIRNLGELAPLV
jgi:HAD superfamily hydrolase (TIGR01549 family)